MKALKEHINESFFKNVGIGTGKKFSDICLINGSNIPLTLSNITFSMTPSYIDKKFSKEELQSILGHQCRYGHEDQEALAKYIINSAFNYTIKPSSKDVAEILNDADFGYNNWKPAEPIYKWPSWQVGIQAKDSLGNVRLLYCKY